MKKLISLMMLSLLVLMGCSDTTQDSNTNDKALHLVYPDGVEAIAISTLSKIVLEEHGYGPVETTYLEVGLLWAALSKGDVDLYMDAWLPFTQENYWDKYGAKLEAIGVLFDHGTTGFVVPSYTPINSILELNDNVALFDGKIYGLGAGSGTNQKTNELIDLYGLNYTQLNTSESAMMAELRRAINSGEHVIITGWTPHYKWNKYDLKMLDDPKKVFPIDRIEIIGRNGFSDDHPELAKILPHFKLSIDELNELIDIIHEETTKDPNYSGAMKFYKKYQEKLDAIFI